MIDVLHREAFRPTAAAGFEDLPRMIHLEIP
jgi:hypothetical protein